MARKYHPDSNPGDKVAEEKFKEINDAYVILSDENKKAEYDRTAASAEKTATTGNPFGYKSTQKTTAQGQPKRKTTSTQAKGDFKMDRESIYNQFSDFFGFKM